MSAEMVPPADQKLRRDARAVFEAAVDAVAADRLLAAERWAEWLPEGAAAFNRVGIVAVGKAAVAMAGVAEARLRPVPVTGIAVGPAGALAALPARIPTPERITVVEGGHPVPDERSLHAGAQVLAMARSLGEADLLLVLLSGGASALCVAPLPGLSLQDLQALGQLLLASGAGIQEINAVRKPLSRIGGGRLAAAAWPAQVRALVVSDVVGDDLATIGSGPTVPSPSTAADAVAVLQARGLWERVPVAVRRALEEADAGPSPAAPGWQCTRTLLVGSNRTALEAARAEAERIGYQTQIVADDATGEAREVGRKMAADLLQVRSDGPWCRLWGGETTVTVSGDGTGGRNQELALAAGMVLESSACPVVLLSAGTDGRDGPTPAAGALISGVTLTAARAKGLIPEEYLRRNDAYGFFSAAGGLLVTGPTHTNVMDVQVAVGLGDQPPSTIDANPG